MEHFGIDLHQKHSDVCGLAESGEIVFQQRIPTRPTEGAGKCFRHRFTHTAALPAGPSKSLTLTGRKQGALPKTIRSRQPAFQDVARSIVDELVEFLTT